MQQRLIWLAVTGVLACGFGLVSLGVWLREDDAPPAGSTSGSVPYGRNLFRAKGCAACHHVGTITEGFSIGPNLSLLSRDAGMRVEGMTAQQYVRVSILAPDAYIVRGFGPEPMPRLAVSSDEADALVAFLLHMD